MLNENIVNCPNECGFRGTYQDVNIQKGYKSPRRLICCPNEAGNAEDKALRIEEEQYTKGLYLRIHCNDWKFPVLEAERDAQNCFETMHKAMESMPNLIIYFDYVFLVNYLSI